jgi:NAD(P)-dependent dehydrogenase (short-subunit alcohol dehydrogenase family)
MGEFEGKVVFITGGTSGIGRGTAIEFGKKNARVAITGHTHLASLRRHSE